MIVGAILDCGASFEDFERATSGVALTGYKLSTRRKVVSGISAVKFDVEVTEPQPERHFGEIRTMLESSALTDSVKRRAIAIFEVLAAAEAKMQLGSASVDNQMQDIEREAMDMQLQDKLLQYKRDMGLLPAASSESTQQALPAQGETSSQT